MTTDLKLDCYAVLGVPSNAEEAVIRAAFAKLSSQYDANELSGTPDEAQRKLSDLTTAYEVLTDPVQRRRYDFHRRISTLTAEFDARDSSPNLMPEPAAVQRLAVTARRRRGLAWYALIAVVLVSAAFGFYQYSGRPVAGRNPVAAAPPVAIDVRPTAQTAPAGAEKPATIAASPVSLPPEAANATQPPNNVPASPQGTAPQSAAAPEACTDVQIALGLCKPKSTRKDK